MSPPRSLDVRAWLTAGFLALTIGIVIAYWSPATGYEASIYGGTPISFWVTVVFVLLLSVFVTFNSEFRLERVSGVILGGLAMLSVVALPLIRGYHYLGENDSMTHLGWTRDINTGSMSMLDLQYPMVHTLGSVLFDVTNTELYHSLLFLLVVFVLIFFIFIPLSVRAITDHSLTVYLGAFTGLCILPINHISGHMVIHTTSQAVMFAPLVLYLFITYYKTSSRSFFGLSTVTVSAFVLLHPQQAVNFLVFIGVIVALQVPYQIAQRGFSTAYGTFVAPFLGVSVLLFWLWASDGFGSTFGGLVAGILDLGTGVGTDITSRGTSLQQLGGSYEEIFVKLFLVALIFSILSGMLMLATVVRTVNRKKRSRFLDIFVWNDVSVRRLLTYFTAGFVAITGLFFGYLVPTMAQYYFRVYAFMMVIVSILGALALGRLTISWKPRFPELSVRRIITVIMMALLLLSLPVVYSSPYIYETSSHVTEAQTSGYERTFEMADESLTYTQVRSSADRYGDAINGPTENPVETQDSVPEHFADQSLPELFDESVYLTITEADRVRDPEVWDGFRYSHDDFAYLNNEPGIDKIHSNGGYDLYRIDPQDTN